MGSNGTTIDSLNIEIKADSQKATRSLKSLGKSVEQLNNAITSFANNDKLSTGIRKMNLCIASLTNSMNSLDTKKLSNLATVFGAVSNNASNSAKKISDATKQIKQSMDSVSKVQANSTLVTDNIGESDTNKIDNDIKAEMTLDTTKANDEIAKMTVRANELKKSLADMSKNGMGVGFKDYDKAYVELDNLTKKLNEYKKSLVTSPSSISSFSKIANALKNISKNSLGAVKGLKRFKSAVGSSNISLSKGFKTILRYAFGIRSVFVLLNKIRNGFKVGSNNLVQYSSEYNNAISSMYSALIKLKNAFAVAFAPIVTVVAPLITKLINMLSTACNYLGQFFGYLTGKQQVAQATDVWKDYAKSIDGATSSTKKLLGLQGFDKLNNLSSGSGSGGGSGSSLSAEDMFTTKDVSSNVKNLVDGFKDAWEKQDWSWFYNKGLDFGTWIKNALDKVDWSKLKTQFSKFGHAIANTINGFVQSGVIQSFGKFLANGINTALSGINAFLSDMNFSELGKAFVQGLGAFFKTLDFGEVGKAIVNAISGAIDFVSGIIEGVDWKNLPTEIATKIKDTLSGIDWKKFFGSLGNYAGNIVKAILDFKTAIAQMEIDIAKEIKNYFVKKFKDAGFDKDKDIKENGKAIIKGLLNGCLEISKTISTWVYNNVIKPFASSFDDALKDNVFYQKGKSIITQVINGFTSLVTNLISSVSSAWTNIKNVWSGASNWFNQTVITPIKTLFNGLHSAVKGIFDGLWIIVKAIWIVASTWFKTNVVTPITNAFAPIKNKIEPIFSGLWAGIKSVWSAVSTWFKTNVTTPLETLFKTFSATSEGIFSGMGKAIKTAIATAINGVLTGVERCINTSIDVINGMLSGFNTIVTTAGKITGDNWSGIGKISHITVTKIPTYASGGYVSQGQMFIARENGAELVGNVNGNTAVMNNDQIVQAVSQGVAQAVASVMANNNSNVTVTLEGDAQGIFKVVRQQDRMYRNINGHSAFGY